jgi:hypothetical protein
MFPADVLKPLLEIGYQTPSSELFVPNTTAALRDLPFGQVGDRAYDPVIGRWQRGFPEPGISVCPAVRRVLFLPPSSLIPC